MSIYQYSGVVFTAILGYLVLDEPLNGSSLIGGLIILGAIFRVFEHHRKPA